MPEPTSTLIIDGHHAGTADVRLEFQDVTLDSLFSSVRLPTLTARTYHPSGARDPDHWALRDLQVEMAGVQIVSMASRPDRTRITGQAFLTEVRRFTEQAQPEIEPDNDPCFQCGEVHPWSEEYLPPVDDSIPSGIEVEFTLVTYTPSTDIDGGVTRLPLPDALPKGEEGP